MSNRWRASIIPMDYDTSKLAALASLLDRHGFAILSVNRATISVEADVNVFKSQLGIDSMAVKHPHLTNHNKELVLAIRSVDFIQPPTSLDL